MTVYQLIQTKDSMVALKLIDSFDCSAHDSMYDYTYGVLTANWSFDSAYTCSNDSFSVHIESDSGKKLYQFFYNAEEIAKDIEKVAYKNKQIAPYKLMVIDACGLKLVFSTAISNGLAPYLNIHFQDGDTLLLGAKIFASATVQSGNFEWFVNENYFSLGKEMRYEPKDTGIY